MCRSLVFGRTFGGRGTVLRCVAGAKVPVSFQFKLGGKKMKNIVLAFVVAFAFCATATAGDIAISTHAGWFGQGPADREAQEIADNVTGAAVEIFASDQQDALADWVVAHTGDGVSDILILSGRIPASIYPAGNAEPDGSLAELFLDDGNTIINTGDYMFYVTSSGSNNATGGLENMMDIAGMDMWGDNTPMAVTVEGNAVAPSLQDLQSDRPFALDKLAGDWVPELILAQNDAGTRADPVIVVNTVTGGRLGIFYQTSGQDNDPRGEVISEWINNYVLTDGVIPNAPARKPNPADGAIDADVASLEWTAGYGAVSHKVYLSTDATIDDADLIGETGLMLQVAVLDPGVTYHWRVDEVAADASVLEGPVWSFSTLPLEAHFPSPADGATNAISLVLSWTPGKNAIMHNVHYGKDPAMLLPVQMMSMNTSYDPGALAPDTTYYWRVDEFTPAGTVTGPVWSFSTIGQVTPSGTPNLILEYLFDEDPSSLAVLDTSGNNHHGVLLGDAKTGGGLTLDGNGDAVDAGSHADYHPAGGFAVTAWIKMTSWGGSWGNAIAGTRGESGLGWQFRRHSGNQNLTFTVRGTPGADDPRGTIVPQLNEWYHVAAVFDPDGGTRSVYINGILDVQIADSGTVAASDHNLYVGARANGGNSGPEAFFNGAIDDLRIHAGPLTHQEIRLVGADLTLPWNPDPANGAGGLSSAGAVLSWNPGDGAILQDVYFGTDAAAVAAADAADTTGIYRGRQPVTTYEPDLASGTTHYWRVDQMAPDGTIVVGPVWSFNTAILIPAAANLGAPTSDVPGFEIYAFKPQDSGGWSYNALNEILDTGLLNGVGVMEEGTRIDEFVNLRDTGNGAFSESNGYSDAAFPGIDPDEVPAQDPAAGDDDNNYGAEIRGCIHLTAGMHRIGANSDDGTIVWIGGIEIGRTGEWKGASNVDLPAFEVAEDGYYSLKARWLEGGGGSSLELHEILADGTRLLLNDVAKGGSAVFAPAQAAGGPELVAAFAFGSRQLDCATYNVPSVNYTMVYHVNNQPETIQYDPAKGYGYDVIYPTDSPFGARAGFGVFGPFDDSANNRNEFPDECPEQLYDSFIGAKSFTNEVSAATMGDMDTPSPNPEGIIFRVDVPNGLYRFVGAFGEADNGHAHRILAEDGGSGPPANIGSNYVVLVHNHDQSQYDLNPDLDEPGDGVFARVGFAGMIPPMGDGVAPDPAFVDMGYDGRPGAAANSPALEVNQGHIRIHQLQGNSNDGPGGSRDANGGDIVILELWRIR